MTRRHQSSAERTLHHIVGSMVMRGAWYVVSPEMYAHGGAACSHDRFSVVEPCSVHAIATNFDAVGINARHSSRDLIKSTCVISFDFVCNPVLRVIGRNASPRPTTIRPTFRAQFRSRRRSGWQRAVKRLCPPFHNETAVAVFVFVRGTFAEVSESVRGAIVSKILTFVVTIFGARD